MRQRLRPQLTIRSKITSRPFPNFRIHKKAKPVSSQWSIKANKKKTLLNLLFQILNIDQNIRLLKIRSVRVVQQLVQNLVLNQEVSWGWVLEGPTPNLRFIISN